MPAFINICPILCVSLPLPEFLWRHMIKLSELPVEKTKIVIADLLCDFVDGEICIRQIKAGLAHFLQDDQFFEGAPGFLFDESTEIIGMEAKMVGGALQGNGQIVCFQIIQNIHDLPLTFGLWRKALAAVLA